jgi:glycerol-3-phosphate dehydrogenase
MNCDVIIVGGGIHGVGVAQAAAAAGYSCALLERKNLAWGTSSRSSKLIHGGLRYLESAQISVVRECLRERTILLDLAPDLVRLVPFHIPVYRHTRRRPWQIRVGLSLYSALAGPNPGASFASLPRSEWDDLDGLTTQGLEQVFRYFDAQTDDARLTRSVMASARSLGAELLEGTELLRADLRDDGVVLACSQNGRQVEMHGRVLVNAAGPWVNEVLGRVTPTPRSRPIEWIQGSHLVLDAEVARGAYYLEALQDGRAVFVLPWQGKAMIGTTETPFHDDPDKVAVLPAERDYLLRTFESYFGRRAWETPRILSEFAGLRVLPAVEGSAFHRSRETVLQTDSPSHPHLLSIYGGKLTAYRATAERVMTTLAPSLPACQRRADTARLPLPSVA